MVSFHQCDPHVGDAERVEQARDGVECLQQRWCRGVQVDPYAAAPGVQTGLPEAQGTGFQQLLVEGVGAEDEGVPPVEVPPPAVEGADDPSVAERSGALGQLGGPVTAGVEIGLDRLRRPPAPRATTDRRSCIRRSRRATGSPRAGTPSARHGATASPVPGRRSPGRSSARGGRSHRRPRRAAPAADRRPPLPPRRTGAWCQPPPPPDAPSMVMARSLKRHLRPVAGKQVAVAAGGHDGRAVGRGPDEQVVGGRGGGVTIHVDQRVAGDMLAPPLGRHHRDHQLPDRVPTLGHGSGHDEPRILGEQFGPLVEPAVVATLAVFAERPPDLVLVLPHCSPLQRSDLSAGCGRTIGLAHAGV